MRLSLECGFGTGAEPAEERFIRHRVGSEDRKAHSGVVSGVESADEQTCIGHADRLYKPA